MRFQVPGVGCQKGAGAEQAGETGAEFLQPIAAPVWRTSVNDCEELVTRVEEGLMEQHPLEGVQREAVEQLARILLPNVPNLLAEMKCASKLIR